MGKGNEMHIRAKNWGDAGETENTVKLSDNYLRKGKLRYRERRQKDTII